MRREFCRGLLRWAGGGFAPPLAGPVASRCLLLGLPSRPQGSPTRSRCAAEALGWTPSRPPAGAIGSERFVPSGRGGLDDVLDHDESTTRVSPRVAAVMPRAASRVVPISAALGASVRCQRASMAHANPHCAHAKFCLRRRTEQTACGPQAFAGPTPGKKSIASQAVWIGPSRAAPASHSVHDAAVPMSIRMSR